MIHVLHDKNTRNVRIYAVCRSEHNMTNIFLSALYFWLGS